MEVSLKLPISRILVPVDFSEQCLGMTSFVKTLAVHYSAKVTLLHVVDPFYTIPATGLSGPVLIPVSSSAIAEREKRMSEFAVAELDGVSVRRLVYEGDPVSQIVSLAESEGFQLIAMPTHGYGVLRQFLIGSVTSKVLHDTACSVMTGVHMEPLPAARAVKFAKILCAVDLGPQSQEIVEWATRLAADLHAQLGIMHAIASAEPGLPLRSSPQFRMELENLAWQKLQKIQVAAGAAAATVHIEAGDAARAVCSFAASSGADLLIIGRRERGGEIGRLPANAYAIIRQSPCPVISI